jgi:hypothetical protein
MSIKQLPNIVKLNVGGTIIMTYLSTLQKYQDSMLGIMFSGRHELVILDDGSIFLDRDYDVFKIIINAIRTNMFNINNYDIATRQNINNELDYLLLNDEEPFYNNIHNANNNDILKIVTMPSGKVIVVPRNELMKIKYCNDHLIFQHNKYYLHIDYDLCLCIFTPKSSNHLFNKTGCRTDDTVLTRYERTLYIEQPTRFEDYYNVLLCIKEQQNKVCDIFKIINDDHTILNSDYFRNGHKLTNTPLRDINKFFVCFPNMYLSCVRELCGYFGSNHPFIDNIKQIDIKLYKITCMTPYEIIEDINNKLHIRMIELYNNDTELSYFIDHHV